MDLGSFPDARDPARPGGPEFLDFNAYDVVVFNWDVLNEDYWFRGETTAGMVDRASLGFLPKWVERGGLLILEAQCRHWIPSQAAYELAVKKPGFRVSKHDYYDATLGTAFTLIRRYSGHPFLSRCERSGVHLFKGGANRNVPWFPEWLKHDAVVYNFDPTRTHSGGFSLVGPDWLPLLRCRFSRLPMLLCRVVGKGVVIASTMYLASSGQAALLAGILEGWGKAGSSLRESVLGYHRRRVQARKIFDLAARLLPSTVLAVAAFWYFSNIHNPYVVAFATATSGIVSWLVLGAARGYLWSTLRELSGRLLRAVWEKWSGG